MSGVCVIGSLNVDFSYRVSKLPVAGETVLARERSTSFGGKGANQAIAAAAVGGAVSMVGAVGTDEQGAAYLERLRVHGVDAGAVTRVAGDTGSAVVMVDDGGENLIVVDAAANAKLSPRAAADAVRAQAPGVVLAQLEIPIPVIEAAVDAMPGDALLVLNPAPMPSDPDVLAPLLPRVDVLVPNRKELGQLARRTEPRTIAEVTACVAAVGFAGTLVATLGGDGAVIVQPGEAPQHVPARQVAPVDTTGAGDAFCGALATGLAAGLALEAAVRQAVDVATESTLVRGAQPPARRTAPDAGAAS